MAAPQRRRPMRKGIPMRRPLNLLTLQMMVQSGVVRRADLDPPSFGSKTRFHIPDEVDLVFVEKAASERGWLARIILGRKSQFSAPKRSWRE